MGLDSAKPHPVLCAGFEILAVCETKQIRRCAIPVEHQPLNHETFPPLLSPKRDQKALQRWALLRNVTVRVAVCNRH